MNTLLRLCFFLLLLLAFKGSAAQDVIVRTNNDSIRCKVIEIGQEKIKFRRFGSKTDPPLEIYKNMVKEVIFESGSKLTVLYDIYHVSSDKTIREKTHALKGDFLAPLFNHFTFSYEQKIKPGLNAEIKAGYIGAMVSRAFAYSEGYLVKGGLKFVWLTESYSKGLKYINPLQGSYLKPELTYSRYTMSIESGKINFNNFALQINFGRQFVIGNMAVFDIYGGAGYGLQNTSYDQRSPHDRKGIDFSYAYSHFYFGKNLPLTLTGGVLIGWIY